MRSGLRALRHLLDHEAQAGVARARTGRCPTWNGGTGPGSLLARAAATGAAHLALLREYGIPAARAERVGDADEALAAAARIGYPVVIKTDQPGIAHKSDAGGVILGIADPGELTAAYADLAARLGPAALVCETVPRGTELALGLVRDPTSAR